MAPLTVGVGLTETEAVKLTLEFPAVPELIYPAVTEGVTLTVFVSVNVFVPVDIEADVPEIEAGAVAEPFATALTR